MGERGKDCIPEKNFVEVILKQSTVVGRKIYFLWCGICRTNFLVKGKEILYNRNRISFRAQPYAQT